MKFQRLVLCAAFLFGCTTQMRLAYGQSCDLGGESRSFPNLNAQLTKWSARTSIELTRDAKRYLFAEFCDAAAEVMKEKGTAFGTLSEHSGPVIVEYLDMESRDGSAVKTIGAILRARLGAAGLFRKTPSQLIKLRIVYKVRPDLLYVNGQEEDPTRDEYFVRPGSVVIRALKKPAVLCEWKNAVSLGDKPTVQCGG